jgi:methyl-accepting chemotaxis protein
MRTKLTVTRKLWLLTGLLIANVTAVGGVEAWNTKALTHELHMETDVHLPAVRAMTLVDMMHDGIRATVFRAFVETENPGADLAPIELEYKEFSDAIVENLTTLAALEIDATTSDAINATKPTLDAYMESGREILQTLKAQQRQAAKDRLPKFTQSFEALESELEKVSELIAANAQASKHHADALVERSEILNVGLLVFGIVGGLLSAYAVIRGLSRTLAEMTSGLTADAQRLSDAANAVNAASETLGQASTQQSAAIEESAASMEEISSMVAQTAQVAQETQKKAGTARDDAATSRQVVQRMVQAMAEISAGNDRLQGIVKVIGDIESRTRVINDIAFETRLLAFNASIEAARAGAHGRGFAVVAEEVGKLAETSNKAADEVRKLLDDSLAQVGEIVRETRSKVEAGQTTSRECEAAFEVIESTFVAINDAVSTIAGAAREQATGITQTNQAMGEMERTTQANARGAERLAAEATQLTRMAAKLDDSAARFHTLVFGGRQRPPSELQTAAPTVGVATAPPLVSAPIPAASAPAAPTVGAAPAVAVSDPASPPQQGSVSRKDPRWRAA